MKERILTKKNWFIDYLVQSSPKQTAQSSVIFKMAKVENYSLEKLGKYELPAEPMHVELYIQDLIKDA